jgi:DNA-directed RNA polymerase subunit RPC12/RpoP
MFSRYKCYNCKQEITIGKRKHIMVCTCCGSVLDLSKIRTKRLPQDTQSILDRILGTPNVAQMSASAILARMGL